MTASSRIDTALAAKRLPWRDGFFVVPDEAEKPSKPFKPPKWGRNRVVERASPAFFGRATREPRYGATMPTTTALLEQVRRRGYLVTVVALEHSLTLIAIPMKRGLERHVRIDGTDAKALGEAALELAEIVGLDVSDVEV